MLLPPPLAAIVISALQTPVTQLTWHSGGELGGVTGGRAAVIRASSSRVEGLREGELGGHW